MPASVRSVPASRPARAQGDAARAGITAPSRYRYLADREQVLDALVERHLDRVTAFIAHAEAGWTPKSVADLVQRELNTYAAYYQRYPNAAPLWLDGRISPTVVPRHRLRHDPCRCEHRRAHAT